MGSERAHPFASRMRRLRGDYGTCPHCKEAFAADSDTIQIGAEKTIHRDCKIVGMCYGCRSPIFRYEAVIYLPDTINGEDTSWPAHAKQLSPLSDGCTERARARIWHEQASRAAWYGESKMAAPSLKRVAIDRACGREQIVAYVVVSKSRAESVAIELRDMQHDAYVAASVPGQKSVAFRASRGQVIVEAYQEGKFYGVRGYDLLLVERRVPAKFGREVVGKMAALLGLTEEKTITEEDL